MKNNSNPLVLVTGATGFLGSRIVSVLLEKGYRVRALVRKTSRTKQLEDLDVDLAIGDIVDKASLKQAFDGVEYVVHAAADTSGRSGTGKDITFQGTENILALCAAAPVRRLVYISSCSVYGVADYKKGDRVVETSALERFPEKRGAYSSAKFQAEQVVLDAMQRKVCPITCLRPGTIFGPGGETYTPMMGFSWQDRFFLTISNPEFILPLVYVDNVADAVRVSLENLAADGRIYNVIDPYRLTKKQYIHQLLKKMYPSALFLSIPCSLLYGIVYIQEVLFHVFHTPAVLTRYRFESSQKPVVFDGGKICRELDWVPPVSLEAAVNKMMEAR